MNIKDVIPEARAALSPNDVEVVLYRSPTNTGFAAAFAAWQHLGDKCKFIPFDQETEFAEADIQDKNVLCLGNGLTNSQTEQLQTHAKSQVALHGEGFSEAIYAYEYFNLDGSPLIPFIGLIDGFATKSEDNRQEASIALDAFLNESLGKEQDLFHYNFRKLWDFMDPKHLKSAILKGSKLLTAEAGQEEKIAYDDEILADFSPPRVGT